MSEPGALKGGLGRAGEPARLVLKDCFHVMSFRTRPRRGPSPRFSAPGNGGGANFSWLIAASRLKASHPQRARWRGHPQRSEPWRAPLVTVSDWDTHMLAYGLAPLRKCEDRSAQDFRLSAVDNPPGGEAQTEVLRRSRVLARSAGRPRRRHSTGGADVQEGVTIPQRPGKTWRPGSCAGSAPFCDP